MVSSRTYQTNDLAKDFAVKPMTVRNWAKQYADHLSDDANPPKGTTRAFSLEDANILALVAQLRKHKSPEEIHARLRNGERGTFPLITIAALDTQETQQQIRQLELQLEDKDQKMSALRKEIVQLNADLTIAKNAPDIELKIIQRQLEDRDKQLAELKAELVEARVAIFAGFIEGFDQGVSRGAAKPTEDNSATQID